MPAPEHALRVRYVCDNLKALRRARSLTQAGLSQAAELNRNHVQELEAGQTAKGEIVNPRLTTLCSLARALKVDLMSLLGEPSPHSVWRWVDTPSIADDAQQAALLDSLLSASEQQLQEGAAAFVGVDGLSLTLGVAVLAADEDAAQVISEPFIRAAVHDAAVTGELTDHVEVVRGIDGLQRPDAL